MKTLRAVIAVVSSIAILGGCATQDGASSDADLQEQLNDARNRADENEVETQRLRSELANARGTGDMSTVGGNLLPPNAEPGHCYARVLIPAQYSTGEETVLARAASQRINVTPAQYKYVEQTVLVQEESIKLEVIPATYKTVTERIMVEPEKTSIKEVPATFETASESILVKPAYTTWKKGRGPIESLNSSTGEIMCLVEVPAEYKTVSKKVVKTPARTVEETIPAKYETVSRKVVDTASSTREVVVPARHDTVKVRQLVSETRSDTVEIPAEYRKVSTRKLVQDSRLEWREILCETNTTNGVVARLQRALNKAGYDAGDADGILGNQTLAAVKKYQLDHNMASGQLTMKVLNDLKVSL